jgi:hypothetical protein
MCLGTYSYLLQGELELDTVSDLFCHLIYWAKCKYTELVVDASMEVNLEENVEKTKVHFMSCHQIAGQYCNRSD